MAHTSYTDVVKTHTQHEGGRHTYGKEWGKTTRIRYGDHVRIGGAFNVRDKATVYSDVEL